MVASFILISVMFFLEHKKGDQYPANMVNSETSHNN